MEVPRPPEPRPEEPAPREEVRVEGSPVRCPFCHADVLREREAWVACAGCMARHHAACWDEGGRCGTCGASERLAPERRGAARLLRQPEARREELPWSALLGAPARVTLEERFEGEASVADAPWLEAELRRGVRRKGRLELGRDGVVWRTPEGDCRGLRVELSASGGRTRLTLEEKLFEPALGVLCGVGGGAGGGGVAAVLGLLKALHPEAGAALVLSVGLVWFVGVVLVARALLARELAARPARLVALRDRLVRGLEAGPWQGPAPTPPPRPSGKAEGPAPGSR